MMMHNVNSNAGGWAQYTLNGYVNNRVYNAFPECWRQLIKQVKVKSSIGDKSNDTSNADCYIFVPSVSEVAAEVTGAPYANEGTLISHFAVPAARICYTLDGKLVQYWTRSPNIIHSNYVYRISATGASQSVTQMNATDVYVRIMFSI
jgi:hypothetical protein